MPESESEDSMDRKIRRESLIGAVLAVLAGTVWSPVSFGASPVSVTPATMPRVGTVDERCQSFNVEMVEVTGGRFWAPYKKQGADAPAVPASAKNSGIAGM